MPASVTSQPPRLAELRTYSNDSIHVNREVMVVSTPDSETPPKTLFPTVENMSNRHARPQSSYAPGAMGAPASQLNRWKSESGISDRVFQLEKSSEGGALLESNRESMRALSEFLMTRDPPSTNWISIPSSDDDRSIKKAAFKIFGRSKSKKSRKKKLLKLPDSAVAATTSSGSRYIAISIPLEGWPSEEKRPMKVNPTHPQPKLSSERPAVTVHPLAHGTPLKPVAEVQESSPSSTPPESKDGNKRNEYNRYSRAESDVTPAAEILGPEATRTLENYYIQLKRQKKRESTLSTKSGTSRAHRSYVAIPPITRQDSQRTNPRHSASTASITSPTSHSRGASSASTAPSANASISRKLDLPARHSSLTKISPTIESELAQIAKPANDKPQEDPPAPSVLSIQSADESIVSGTTTSQSPPAVLGTAETAQNYSAGTAGLQTISRDNTPKPPIPAPTKRLPDIPVNQSISSSPPHRSTPSPVLNKSTPRKQPEASSPGREANAEESLQVTRQSRQDRVKARKLRDMAIIREKSNVVTRAPLESGTGNSNRIPLQKASHLTTLARSTKRRSASQDPIHKNTTMEFSPIMVVATTSPTTTTPTPIATPRSSPTRSIAHRSNLLSPHDPSIARKSPRNSLNAARVRNRDTQSSLASSYVCSDSDTIPLSQSTPKRDSNSTNRSLVSTQKRGSNSTSQSLVSSPARSSIVSGTSLDARRQERRSKRNMSLKEKELDARLKKIERDNAMLLSTLSGIASSFQELHRLYPNGHRRGRGGRALLEDRMKKGGESGEEAGLDA